jgi:hypothetical protein
MSRLRDTFPQCFGFGFLVVPFGVFGFGFWPGRNVRGFIVPRSQVFRKAFLYRN